MSISQLENIIQIVLIASTSDDEANEKAKSIEGMAPSGIGREVLDRWNQDFSRKIPDPPPTSSWWVLETPMTRAWCGSGRRPSGGHGGGGGAIGGEIVPQPPPHVLI